MDAFGKHTFSWQLPVLTLLVLLIAPALLHVLRLWLHIDFDWLLPAIIAWAAFSAAYFGLMGWKAYLAHQSTKQVKEYEHLKEMEREAREERGKYGTAQALTSPPPTIEEVLNSTQALIDRMRAIMGREQSENPEIRVLEERIWKITLDYVQKQFPLAVAKEEAPPAKEIKDESANQSIE